MKKLKLLTGLFLSAILTVNATVVYGAVTADANYNTLKLIVMILVCQRIFVTTL